MKIAHIEVQGFRSLQNVQVPIHDYTTFVGPNGAGKSTFLYALDWFFGNREITAKDRTVGTTIDEITVSVTFGSLSDSERESLGAFVIDDRVLFKRSFSIETGKSTYTGFAKHGPGFGNVLADSRVAVFRPAYKRLREELPDLPDLSGSFSFEQVNEAFEKWILDPRNDSKILIGEQAADFYFSVPGSLGDLCQFVLIPGSLNLSTEMQSASKSSLLNVLTSKLIESARNQTINEWKTTYAEAITELRKSTRDAVNTAIDEQSQKINSMLSRYDNRSEIDLAPTDPEVEIRYPTAIAASVRDMYGNNQPIENQGHGVQRAVIMAMVEALHSDTPVDPAASTKLTILAAEEPEIYQHPVRARGFAQTLKRLAEQDDFQIILATHSASFVSYEFMDSLRFTRMGRKMTYAKHSSLGRLAKIRNEHINKASEWFYREIPKSFTDAFFSDLVVIVEGPTDAATITEVADLLDSPFEQAGIICIGAGSKNSLALYRTILQEFGVPTFIVFDGDYCDDLAEADEDTRTSCRRQTEQCVKDFGLLDESDHPLYSYGDPSGIFDGVAIFQRELEIELDAWPSYQQASKRLNKSNEKKNDYRYRRAVQEAHAKDIPNFLRLLIDTIIQHAVGPSNKCELS